MNAQNDPFDVWLGLICISDEIWKYTAATTAYEKVKSQDVSYAEGEKSFLDLAASAIWQQLLLDISKVFDSARTCGNENCSINMLRELCATSPKFDSNEHIKIAQTIDSLCKEYETVIAKSSRNKHIAHFDLSAFLNKDELNVSFKDVSPFVIRTAEFLSEISNKFLRDNTSLVFNSLNDVTLEYEKNIRSLSNAN